MLLRSEIITLEEEYKKLVQELEESPIPKDNEDIKGYLVRLEQEKKAILRGYHAYENDIEERMRIDRSRHFVHHYLDYSEQLILGYKKFLTENIEHIQIQLQMQARFKSQYLRLFRQFSERREKGLVSNQISALLEEHPFLNALGITNDGMNKNLYSQVYDNYFDSEFSHQEIFTNAYNNGERLLSIAISNGIEDPILKDLVKLNKKYHDELAYQQEQQLGIFNARKNHEDDYSRLSDRVSKEAGRLESAFMNIKKELFADETFSFLGKVRDGLGWLSAVFAALLIPVYFYRMAHAAFNSDERLPTRVFNVGMGIVGLVISILCVIVAAGAFKITAPILIMAGAAKSFVENAWHFGTAVYDRYVGTGKKITNKINEIEEYLENKYAKEPGKMIIIKKEDAVLFERLTELQNLKQHYNAKMFDKGTHLVEAGMAVIGAGLLFSPAAAVGVMILLVVAGFAIANVIKSYASSKSLIPNPFETPSTIEDTQRDFSNRLGKRLGKSVTLSIPIEDKKQQAAPHSTDFLLNQAPHAKPSIFDTQRPLQEQVDIKLAPAAITSPTTTKEEKKGVVEEEKAVGNKETGAKRKAF